MDVDTTQGITVASVPGDHKAPFVKDSTRLEFLDRYIPYWRLARQYRAYSVLLAVLGVFLLFRFPVLAVPAFAAAAYFHVAAQLKRWYSQGEYAQHRTAIGADI